MFVEYTSVDWFSFFFFSLQHPCISLHSTAFMSTSIWDTKEVIHKNTTCNMTLKSKVRTVESVGDGGKKWGPKGCPWLTKEGTPEKAPTSVRCVGMGSSLAEFYQPTGRMFTRLSHLVRSQSRKENGKLNYWINLLHIALYWIPFWLFQPPTSTHFPSWHYSVAAYNLDCKLRVLHKNTTCII